MEKLVLRIVGLAGGGKSDFDGQFIVEYDPTRPGTSPSGKPIIAHLVVSPDKSEALVMTFAEALRMFQRSHGVRDDGKPSRPITAFNVEFVRASR